VGDYDPRRKEDLRELALDLVTTDGVQRAMAVVYSFRHGMLVPPASLRLPMELARLRFGERRGMTLIAMNLSRRPADLSLLWEGLLSSIARGGPDADGRIGARLDEGDVEAFVAFMRRAGWHDGRLAEADSTRKP
jgi:hypothetical protein